MKLNNVINRLTSLLKKYRKEASPLSLPLMPDAAEALTVCALAGIPRTAVLWITSHPDRIELAHRYLHTLDPTLDACVLPFPNTISDRTKRSEEDPDITGRRIQTLLRLAELPATVTPVILTCPAALLQPTHAPDQLRKQVLRVDLNADLDPLFLTERLSENGYRFESEVLDKGQAARRGGILDLWPPDSDWPLRIEWFGNTVESLRRFDPGSQRAIEPLGSFLITPAAEPQETFTEEGLLLDHLQAPLSVLWSDAEGIRHQFHQSSVTDAEPDAFERLLLNLNKRNGTWHIDCGGDDSRTPIPPEWPEFSPLPCAVSLPATAGTDQLENAREKLLSDLNGRAGRKHDIYAFFETAGAQEYCCRHLLADLKSHLSIHSGTLPEGFCSEALKFTILSESDFYGRRKRLQRFDQQQKAKTKAGRYAGSRIQDFTDMESGDLVVHAEHGVGRYLGVQTINFNNALQEVLAIEYAEQARLYVPVTHANLLSRYVGMANRTATLHRLGGQRWKREKGAAEAAVYDLAAELLEIQARRNLLQGHAFASDTYLQHEFENAFEFEETEDQKTVIQEIRQNMESSRPMDRLVCGDAGYGKTEVAMRAAFKAVQEPRQVAVLVPTTVLAQQHFQTFSERMAGFGVRIEVISRFQSPARRREIRLRLAEGGIDIIIGTHALVQPGIRFANLGLVVIDEEQRFGVAHKEQLKKVRHLVDVLTLSATPIPRTLYMSMTGARDMSLLRTPPRERVPIETMMVKRSDDVIRHAIVRELQRGGQVFFLHNRVASIQRLRQRLCTLIPEARIAVAHGQMKSTELASVMQRFSEGVTDVLLCTTIIESGMDIPHANTILIDRADRFGIADLYQLRGRVGRSDRKAYAILMLPPHGMIDSDARERIQAVRRHSGLSSGFNLAIRDMEIRGAGNILGSAQSGHISAVGFGLYCKLLQQAVTRLKGEASVVRTPTEIKLDFISAIPENGARFLHSSAIPQDYIQDERLRVSIYRRLADTASSDDLNDLQQEISDRFGPAPPSLRRLLSVIALRICATRLGIERIEVRNHKIMIRQQQAYILENGRFPALPPSLTPEECLDALQHRINLLAAAPGTPL